MQDSKTPRAIEPEKPAKPSPAKAGIEPKRVVRDYEDRIEIGPEEILERLPARPRSELKETVARPPDVRYSVELRDVFRNPPVQRKAAQGRPPSRPQALPDSKPAERHQGPGAQRGIEPKGRDRRILQKEILQDLHLFGISPDSFEDPKKGIEKINIPEKADVKKKWPMWRRMLRIWAGWRNRGRGGTRGYSILDVRGSNAFHHYVIF